MKMTNAQSTLFIAGFNIPGYMPEAEPVEFDSFVDAKQYVIACIKHDENNVQDESDAETLCALAEDVNLESNAFTTQVVAGCVYWVVQEDNTQA